MDDKNNLIINDDIFNTPEFRLVSLLTIDEIRELDKRGDNGEEITDQMIIDMINNRKK